MRFVVPIILIDTNINEQQVFLDLFATLVQPGNIKNRFPNHYHLTMKAAMIYIAYLLYSVFGVEDETATFPLISLIMIGAIYGLQVIILLLAGEWQNIGWMIIVHNQFNFKILTSSTFLHYLSTPSTCLCILSGNLTIFHGILPTKFDS